MDWDSNTAATIARAGRAKRLTGRPSRGIVPRVLSGFAAGLIWLLALLAASPALPQASVGTRNLAPLREQALEFVNAARQERGLVPLKLSDRLNEVAQLHAEDMLARSYFAHVSPEGEDIRDRYLALGGDSSRLLAENIAQCTGCAALPDAALMRELQQQWMQSPEHRDNILRRGLTRFGFGMAVGEGGLYAVQTFAGPGTARGAGGSEAAEPLSPGDAAEAFCRAVNARREMAMWPALELDPTLSMLAAKLLPASADEAERLMADGALVGALPRQARENWAALSVMAGSCAGCGTEATRRDIGFFVGLWLAEARNSGRLLAPAATSVGFALRAYGDGRKVAIAVVGVDP